MNKQQTPLEKLISNRLQLQAKCDIQKQKLNEHFSYIQENAGNLFLSGISSLLFSPSKEKKSGTETNYSKQTSEVSTASLGFSDYISVVQSLLPMAWDVARPLLTPWGLKKIQTWAIKKLFTKKRQT
jgi:hypothetical protein